LAPGTFTFKVETAVGTTTMTTLLYENIPVASTTKASIDIGATSSPLRIDINGDGVTDFALTPGQQQTASNTIDMVEAVVKTMKFLNSGTQTSILSRLENIRRAIQEKRMSDARQMIQDLIADIRTKSGKQISPTDAEALISMIDSIRIVVL